MKFMKTVKVLVLTIPLVFSLSTLAEGQEELCSRVADSDVRMKHLLLKDKKFLDFALEDVSKGKASSQAALREKLFFIHNRLHLSDAELKRVSFLRCITDTW